MRKNLFPGIVLILAGLYLLIGQFYELSYGVGVAFVGLALLSARISRGPRGLTIAGSIVLCVGLAMALADARLLNADLTATAVVALLAVSFFLMHVLDFQRIGHWPLLPGLCLLGAAVLVYIYGYDRLPQTLWGWVAEFWPVALICVGAATLGGVMRTSRRRKAQVHAQQHAYEEAEKAKVKARAEEEARARTAQEEKIQTGEWQQSTAESSSPETWEPAPATEPESTEPETVHDATDEPTTAQPYEANAEEAEPDDEAPIILGAPPANDEGDAT